MAISICVHDVEEDFDYFMAGMAACSGISICPEEEDAQMYFDDLCEFFGAGETEWKHVATVKSYILLV